MTDTRRPKGTGSVRRRGDRWQATYSYTAPDGRRRRRSSMFDTKTEAREFLNARLAEVASGQVADAGAITVGEYLGEWLGSLGMQQLEPTTVSWYRSAVERHIVPALGSVKLSRLSPVQVEVFLADKAANGRLDGSGGLGARSVQRLAITLRKALAAAVRKGLLTSNPVDLADKPKATPADVTLTVWTPEQVRAFLNVTAEDRHGPLWHVAAMTGLRRSEVCGLWWSDVDLDGERLNIRRAVVVADGRRHVKAPKTAASRRVVDIDSGTVTVLREWRRRQVEERLRAGSAWSSGEWAFTNEIGVPVSPDWLSRRFADLVAGTSLPRISLRQLRHSHATSLLSAGVNPKIVQERLGHSSISVTLDIYSAVLPTMQREAVDKLAALMGAIGAE